MASILDILKNAALSKVAEVKQALKTQATKPVVKQPAPVAQAPATVGPVPKFGYGTLAPAPSQPSDAFQFTPAQTKDYNFYSALSGGNLTPEQNKQFLNSGRVDFTDYGKPAPVYTPAPLAAKSNTNYSHSSPLLVALGLQEPEKASGITREVLNQQNEIQFNRPSPLSVAAQNMPNIGDLFKNAGAAAYEISKPIRTAIENFNNSSKFVEPRLYNEIDDPNAAKAFNQAMDKSKGDSLKLGLESAKIINPELRGMTMLAPAASEVAGIFGKGVREKVDPLISNYFYYNPKYVAGNLATSALQGGADIVSNLFTGKDVRKNIAESGMTPEQQEIANTGYDMFTNFAGAGFQGMVSGKKNKAYASENPETSVLGFKGKQEGVEVSMPQAKNNNGSEKFIDFASLLKVPGSQLDKNGMKERGLITSMKETPLIAPEVQDVIGGTYKKMSLKQNEAQAQLKLNTMGADAATDYLLKKQFSTPEDNALARSVIKQLTSEGRYDTAVKIAEDAAKKATTAGQASASLRMWSDLGPEGIVNYANKLMADANDRLGAIDKMINKKFGRDYAFTDAEKADFLKKAQDLVGMKDGKEKMKATQELLGSISERLPFGISDAIDNYRYNSMLSGPPTQLRNIYGNALQTFVTKPLTDIMAGTKDAFTSWITGSERQKYVSDVVPYYGRALAAVPKGMGEFIKTMRGENPVLKQDISPTDLASMATSRQYKPKGVVERALTLDNIPIKTAEAMDRIFSTIMQDADVPRFMKRFGMSEVDARDAVQQESAYYLYRNRTDAKNETGQGHLLSKIDAVTNGVESLRKSVPGLKWFIPFLKTPMNVAKQWIEYSPLGIATLPGAKDKGGQLAKTMVGSMFSLYGGMKAANGEVTWDSPTDPEQKKLFYATGKKPYSVKVRDKWVPLQYFGPFALAMGIPAAVKYHAEDSTKALSDDYYEKVSKMAGSAMQFFSQQTFMSGLGNFVKAAEGDSDVTVPTSLGFTAGQFIPASGLLRFIAGITDPTRRKANTFTDSLKAGIPMMKDTLEPVVNPDGSVATKDPWSSLLYEMGKVNDSAQGELDARTKELQLSSLRNAMMTHAEDLMREQIRTTGKIPMDKIDQYRLEAQDNAAPPSKADIEKALKQEKYSGYTNEQVADELLADNITTARRAFNSKSIDSIIDLGAIYTDDTHRSELKERLLDMLEDQVKWYESDGDANTFIDKTLDKLEAKWRIKL